MRPLRMINRPASNQKTKSIPKNEKLFSLDCTSSFTQLKHSEILIPASTQISNINSFQNRKLSYSSGNNQFSQSFLSIKEGNQEQPQLRKINLEINVEKLLQEKQQTIEHFKLQLQQAKYLISNLKQQNKKLLDEISILKAVKKQDLAKLNNIRQQLQSKFQQQINQFRQKVNNLQDQIQFLNSRRDKDKQRFNSYEQIIKMLSQKIKILEKLVQNSNQKENQEELQFMQQEEQELQTREMEQLLTNHIESVIEKVFSHNLTADEKQINSTFIQRENRCTSKKNQFTLNNKVTNQSDSSRQNQNSNLIKQNHPSTPKNNNISIQIGPFNQIADTNQQIKWTQSSINKQNNHKNIFSSGENIKNKQNSQPKGYIVELKQKQQDLPQTKRSYNCPSSSRKVSFSPYKLKERTINQNKKISSSSLSKQNKFQKSMDFSGIHIQSIEHQSYFSKQINQNCISKPLFMQKKVLQEKDLNCMNLNNHQGTSLNRQNRQKQNKNKRIALNQKSPSLAPCQLTDFQFQLKPTNNRFKKLDKKIYF